MVCQTKIQSKRMPNAQVVTEGFPLHALGLNSSLHMSLHTADTETYSLQQKFQFCLTILKPRVMSVFVNITIRAWRFSSVIFPSSC